MKTPKNFRLSEECVQLLRQLKARMGITETDVVELAVRRLAEEEEQRIRPRRPDFA